MELTSGFYQNSFLCLAVTSLVGIGALYFAEKNYLGVSNAIPGAFLAAAAVLHLNNSLYYRRMSEYEKEQEIRDSIAEIGMNMPQPA